MSIKIGVVMDPIQSVTFKKDSTLAMLWAAQDRGWQIYYMEQSHLFIEEGKAKATMSALQVHRNPDHWYDMDNAQIMNLSDMDVILMRKDPPFDNNYIYSTYMLEMAEKEGTLIVNKPQSLRDCNEKVFATHFPQCGPTTMVGSDPKLLRQFHQDKKDVIFKPLEGMGGTAIFRVKENDPNVSVILEMLTDHGKTPIMAQAYIPDIKSGDKRILVINGEPIPYALARIPAKGETRGNLAAGGTGEGRPLTDRDRWICEQVAPTLKEKGLIFVGLDVIGDYLTEINVTSPTCIRELDRQFGLDIAGKLMDHIALLLEGRQ